jgi:phage-related protein
MTGKRPINRRRSRFSGSAAAGRICGSFLPRRVVKIGFALSFAQNGREHPSAMPLKGFHGAGVLEIVEDCRGDAYRAIYTVRFASAVYVLHAFKKKSKSGIATPRHEMELVERRLKAAETDYQERYLEEQDEKNNL